MSKQNRNPKRSVVFATVFAVLAVLAFAAVFWIYDGVSVVEDLLGMSFTQAEKPATTPGDTSGGQGGSGDVTSSADATGSTDTQDGDTGEPSDDDASGQTSGSTGLKLPKGMSEEFALRLWQEQIDSQKSIERLLANEIEKLVVTDVAHTDEDSRLSVTAYLSGGGTAQGYITMRKVGENWFFTNLSGISGEKPDTESDLPALEDVDPEIVNVMIEEQIKSADVLEEYATGAVEEVRVTDIVDGPGTKTLSIVMNETHETGMGDVVLVSKEIDGETVWFIVRFTKA